jgi:hypothetical protein
LRLLVDIALYLVCPHSSTDSIIADVQLSILVSDT